MCVELLVALSWEFHAKQFVELKDLFYHEIDCFETQQMYIWTWPISILHEW